MTITLLESKGILNYLHHHSVRKRQNSSTDRLFKKNFSERILQYERDWQIVYRTLLFLWLNPWNQSKNLLERQKLNENTVCLGITSIIFLARLGVIFFYLLYIKWCKLLDTLRSCRAASAFSKLQNHKMTLVHWNPQPKTSLTLRIMGFICPSLSGPYFDISITSLNKMKMKEGI